MTTCPQCDSKAFKKNGFTRHGKQNHRCLECGRQFSSEPEIQSATQKFALATDRFLTFTCQKEHKNDEAYHSHDS